MQHTAKDLLDVVAVLLIWFTCTEGDPSLCPIVVLMLIIQSDCVTLLSILTTAQDDVLKSG
jgi:hypothetical protein